MLSRFEMEDFGLITLGSPLRVASRASRLALVQADEVCSRLSPLATEVESFSTRGDEVLDRRLSEVGGKGLFTKALEEVLLGGGVDVATHSAKDIESEIAAGTSLVAFLEREDRRDALVGGYSSLEELPSGSVVGTSSPRRSAMLQAFRGDIEVKLLRGNIETRLRRLEEGAYDAIVLAKAGLNRLGIYGDVHALSEDEMLPACGQGVIAVQARDLGDGDDARYEQVLEAVRGIGDESSFVEVTAERAVLRALGGDCHTAVGVVARFEGGEVHLRARLLSEDGKRVVECEARGLGADAAALGDEVGRDLLERRLSSH